MGRLRQIERAARAGLAFTSFGAGGLYLSTVVMPRIRARAASPEEARAASQDALREAFRGFLRVVERVGLVRFELAPGGLSLPGGPFVAVSNHPTIFDVITVTSTLPRSVCVAKSVYARSAAFGPLLRQCGYLDGGDGGPTSIEALVAQGVGRLREGCPLLIFAEGTRSPPGDLLPLGRLAFEIAQRAEVPIVPLALRVDPPVLTKGRPWYRFPQATVRYELIQLPTVRAGKGRRGAREAMKEVERLLRAALGLDGATGGPTRGTATERDR